VPTLTKARWDSFSGLQIKSDPQQATLEPVPNRAQLAFALMLLLVLAPLAGATCGIQCLAVAPHHPISAVASQQPCVRAATCCHSTGAAVCTATQAPETVAALLSTGTNALHNAPAIAVIAAGLLSQDPRTRTAQTIASSPPGQLRITPNPLRI
jgi:hypothetical protein